MGCALSNLWWAISLLRILSWSFYVGMFRKSWVLSTMILWLKHRKLFIRRWIGGISLGRYNKNPRMRVQKAENVNMALEFITSRGVKLTTSVQKVSHDFYWIYLTNSPFLARYHRWKPQTHPWHDMDTHSTLHHRGYQVRHIISPRLLQHSDLFILSFSKAKKASPQKKDYSSGVNARQNLTKKSTCRMSHIAGLIDSASWWTECYDIHR